MSNNGLVVYNGSSLSKNWVYNTSAIVQTCDPVVDSNGNIYVFETTTGDVISVDPLGDLRWTWSPAADAYDHDLLVDNSHDLIYYIHGISTTQARVEALNLSDGLRLWTFLLDGYPRTGKIAQQTTSDYLYFQAWVVSGGALYTRVYRLNIHIPTLVAMDLAVGTQGLQKPVLLGNYVYVYGASAYGDQHSRVSSLWAAANLTVHWTLDVGHRSLNGMIYDSSGELWLASQTGTGELLKITLEGVLEAAYVLSASPGNDACYPLTGVVSNEIYLPSSSGGKVYAYSDVDGTEIRNHTIGSLAFVNSGVITSDGWWILKDSGGNLHKVSVYDFSIHSIIDTGLTDGSSGIVISADNVGFTCSLNNIVCYMQGTPGPVVLTLDGQGNVVFPYFNLSWTYPSSNGSQPLLGYVLWISFDNITYDEVSLISGPGIRTYNDSDVFAFVETYYKITAFNSLGNGTDSNVVHGIINVQGETITGGFIDKTMMIMAIIIVIALLLFVGSIKKGGK